MAREFGQRHNAGAVRSFEPSVAGKVPHQCEIAISIARILSLAVRCCLELVDSVFCVRENCEGNRSSLSGERLEAAGGWGAGCFKIVFAQDPQLWRLERAKRWHRVVAERCSENKGLTLLTQLALTEGQDKVGVIAVEILVPRLAAVLCSHCVKVLKTFGEAAFEHRF